MRKITLVLALLLSICLAFAGCEKGETPVITGVEDGGTYILGVNPIFPEFDLGTATLSKDGGEPAEFVSGQQVTEAGTYQLTVTYNKKSYDFYFTVTEPEVVAPVVTGVIQGTAYEYGTILNPVFDKGTAELQKDSGEKASFISGTAISEVGSYVLTVSFEETQTIVSFSITLPDYSGQITDEFLGNTYAGSYSSSDAIFSLASEQLTITDKVDNQAWGIIKRKIEHVNVTQNPYIEISIDSLSRASSSFKLATAEWPTAEQSMTTTFEVSGVYYIDVKAFAQAKSLDLTDTTVYLDIACQGKITDDGNISAVYNYYKSVSEIPELLTAGKYTDNTMESLNLWKADTANLQWFEEDGFASGVVTDPDNGYGKILKRVNLNTAEYPFLLIDIEEVVDSWKLVGFKFNNWILQGTEIILAEGNSACIFEANLVKILGESQNIDIVLHLYLVGKSQTKMFKLNGLETVSDPYYAPGITGVSEGAQLNLGTGPAVIRFDKGTAMLSIGGGEAVSFESGSAITEKGSYTITVTCGSKSTTVNFTVIEEEVSEDLIDDFSVADYTVGGGMDGTAALIDGNFVFTRNSGAVKMTKTFDFDFTSKNVLVLDFQTYNDYIPNGGFSYELLLEGAPWQAISANFDNALKISYDAGNGKTGYRLYIVIDKAVSLDGSGNTVWNGCVINGVKFSVTMQGDAGIYQIQFNELRYGSLDELAEIDDFSSVSGFTVESGTSGMAMVDGYFTLTKDENIGTIKIVKQYTFNFAISNVLVLDIQMVGSYLPDAGFVIDLLDDINWYQISVRFDGSIPYKTYDAGDGKTGYRLFILIENAVKVGGTETALWAGTVKTLKVKFTIEYGDAQKQLVFNSFMYGSMDEYYLIEDFASADGFTKESGEGSFAVEDGKFILTRDAVVSYIKIVKELTFDFSNNVLIFEFETVNGYIPDAGFVVNFLDDVNWYEITFRFDANAVFESETLSNGNTLYRWKLTVNEAVKCGGSDTVVWKDTVKTVKVKLMIEYGDTEKKLAFNSISYEQ